MTIQDPEARRLLAEINSSWARLMAHVETRINNMEDRTATEATGVTHNSKLVPFPRKHQTVPASKFMLQDVFVNEPNYSPEASGRL